MEAHSDEYRVVWKLAVFCLLIGGLIVILNSFMSGPGDDSRQDKPVGKVDLHADVVFRDKFLTIHNRDNFDWDKVEIEITSSYVSEFKGSANSIRSGSTLVMAYSEFAGKNGTRLDPTHMNTKKVTIWCTTNNGKGLWYGEL